MLVVVEPTVEQELHKATKWDGTIQYPDRQDYLAALCKAVDRLPDAVFKRLSEEATDWFNEAVDAHNSKEWIPDFGGTDVNNLEPQDKPPLEDEFAPEGVPVPTPEEVAEAESKFEPKGKAYKKQVRAKAGRPKGGPSDAPRKPYDPETATHDYSKLSGERDRFGVLVGTKTHKAVQMYERGTTAHELATALGGRYYNILTKFQKEGHLVEKFEGGQWRLTHKDDVIDGKRKGE